MVGEENRNEHNSRKERNGKGNLSLITRKQHILKNKNVSGGNERATITG